MPTDEEAKAAEIERAIARVGTKERAEKEKAYLKSELRHLGAAVPAVRNVVKSFRREHGALDHDALLAFVETLWAKPVHELRLAAIELLVADAKKLETRDVPRLERMLREAKTWALLDPLAESVVGVVVERFPSELAGVLDRWAADDDFWIRRAALLALLVPLRRGGGDFERFARYADAMLEEREFFVRKAIGWVLRDTSRKRPALVRDWILPRAGRASGVTIREAVKYLAPADRDAVLAAYRER